MPELGTGERSFLLRRASIVAVIAIPILVLLGLQLLPVKRLRVFESPVSHFPPTSLESLDAHATSHDLTGDSDEVHTDQPRAEHARRVTGSRERRPRAMNSS